MIVTLEHHHLIFAIQMGSGVSNNEAEYKAVLNDNVGGRGSDLQLITQQILGNFEIKEEMMQRYVRKVREAIVKFSAFTLEQISREESEKANALARLASSVE